MSEATPSLREQGIQALQEGNIDKAVDLLARAVMADDNDLDAKAVLGVAYSQKGLHAQAKRALQTTVERAPHNANFRYNLGVVLQRAGDQQGAAVAFRDTLQVDPKHAQAKQKLQEMGPAVHQLLASAPKPPDPVGVPTGAPQPPSYGQPPMAPPPPPGQAGPPSFSAPAGPPVGGPPIGGPPPAPGYAAPAGPPGYGPPGMGGPLGAPPAGIGGGLNAPQGPPGTVQCSRCGQFTKPGLSCEWCSAPLAAPARPAAASASPIYGSPSMAYAKPHRGGLILALGLLGFFICGLCGIAAWVMGNSDLQEMDAGMMDASGRGLTNAGRIIGMIVTCLLALYVVVIVLAILLPVLAGGSR